MLTRSIVGTFSMALMVLGAAGFSQEYPNRPIRIVTGAPGGGSDFAARLIAQGLNANLGQPVIVDNRGGNTPIGIVSQAPPDGYTLLIDGGSFWTAPLLQKTSYDPIREFSPISVITSSPNVLVVHPSVPAKSVKELIALAKAKPGELNYAAGALGGSSHLAPELFKSMAGVNIVYIPYKGSGPAIVGLLSGQVQLMFAPAASAAAHIKSGKLNALAVTSAQPSALVPGLPTVAASGLPGYESASTQGIFAPAITPTTIIDRLNQEIVRVLKQPDVKQKFFDSGVEAVGSSPKEFAAVIKSDMVTLGKVIKDAGIKAQ